MSESPQMPERPQMSDSAHADPAAKSRGDLFTQAYRFIISGAISAIPDIALTEILQLFFGYNVYVARTVGFIVGTTVAYLINRRWTFGAEKSWKNAGQVAILYSITYFVNIGLQALCQHIGLELGLSAGVAIAVAYVIAQGTATVINFFVQRLFIFAK